MSGDDRHHQSEHEQTDDDRDSETNTGVRIAGMPADAQLGLPWQWSARASSVLGRS